MNRLTGAAALSAITAATITASTIGTALIPGLLPTRPELLLVLSPGNIVLLLVAHRTSFAVYYGAGLTRLVLSDIAPYLLGYLHGRRGAELVVRRDAHRAIMERHTADLRPMALVALVVSASAVVSALAGLTRIRPALFLLLDFVGASTRLLLFWWLAGLFSNQLDALSATIEDWQRYLLVIGLAFGAVVTWGQYRRRNGPAGSPE